MLRFGKKILQFYKCSTPLKDWLLVEETWYLKLVKDLTLKFSLNESFFSEKQFSNFHTIIPVSFPSGQRIDEVVDNIEHYQGYELDVSFLQCLTLTVVHFKNGWKKFERLLEELFSMYASVLITVYDVNITKSKSHNKKARN